MDKEMFGYKFNIDNICIHSESSGERYGEWSESYINQPDQFIESEPDHPDVVCPYKLEQGDSAFVVWAEWSTGDSFGRGERNSVEAIAMFKDIKSALDLKNKILVHNQGKEDKYHFKCLDGQEIKLGYAAWKGYFETLEDVNVTPVVVNNGDING